MPKSAFHVEEPEFLTSCVVFASPHSGRDYPWSFINRTELDETLIRSSEDAYVDRLFDCAPAFGAPLLCAGAPRAFIDLNRSSEELDPALINGVRRGGHNPRVASGLGVVPRVVANGRAIYRGKMSMDEARDRIDRYWRPYHDQLQALLDRAHAEFGQAILIDCHSMPREAVEGVATKTGKRPEIVIGDRFGAAASTHVVDQIEAAFQQAGFVVSRNAPFAGAFITQHYGRPSRNQHAIQIEIDRSLYMEEASIMPHAGFRQLRQTLRNVIAMLSGLSGKNQQLAAE
ncbi:N-formylglutamate amidohydrolase [Pseudoprimorskyibacter insulae]|uniref:N-formylglutamate amidohydrolase n=1 Tax=Pseudoprimorskyibacter insulae TaxID=1695997 RepID=A0A2R8AUU4_9RHOB|nr:N-formylglutamate amidohydrolase [Pseudoprimorskyibacter insulae]SPF79793.1 hypothetical protein PRI8871_01591 [Pseudoprimorskyibacter insulae]